MNGNIVLSCLLLFFVTMVTAGEEEIQPPSVPLPVITSVEVETSAQKGGAVISVYYIAPEEPDTLWFVNALPIQGDRPKYLETKTFSNKIHQGLTQLSTLEDKHSFFSICLHNVVAEVCAALAAPFPDHGVLRQDLHIPWPRITPGPVVQYREGQRVKIHAPVLNNSYSYIYTAFLYSKNSDPSQDRLVQAVSQGMEGQGHTVTITPVTKGSGWTVEVDTDHEDYEGTLVMNATLLNFNELVMGYAMFRPFSLYRQDHTAPFMEGFVAPISNPVTWKCIPRMDCMVICPFVSNGKVKATISRPATTSDLDLEQVPGQPEVWEASLRLFGPYMGYAYVFFPNFQPEKDAGTYQCTFTTSSVSVAGEVEVA